MAHRAVACWRLFAVATILVTATSCARSSPTSSYGLVVRVDSDPDQPLPGASVSYLGRSVGQTGDGGTLGLAIRGTEGEHVALTLSCPDGFQSPGQPTDVVLHRLSEPGRKPEYDLRCLPLTRNVVVIVRADHCPRLPVLYLGKEVARTDESGAAHALLRVPASDNVDVTISTSEPGGERLRPQNPSMKFSATDPDDIKVFSVSFALEPEKRHVAAARLLPVRLN